MWSKLLCAAYLCLIAKQMYYYLQPPDNYIIDYITENTIYLKPMTTSL